MSEVERVYTELCSLRSVAVASNSPSDIANFEVMASKTLLLAAASNFERQICEGILTSAKTAGTRDVFVAFMEKQGLERKYHTMFRWEAPNINYFLSRFGEHYKERMELAIRNDEVLSLAARDFIYINSQRNLLVHNNFASFNLDAGLEDIWNEFVSGKRLSDWLQAKLTELAMHVAGG
jgi:hypothetical protein